MTARRRSRYTREEMQRILADRDSHPNMTVIEWAKQYPISTSLFYKFQERLATKPKKRIGRPPGVKDSAPRKAKGKPIVSSTIAELTVALNNARHWRKEVARLAEQLIADSQTE